MRMLHWPFDGGHGSNAGDLILLPVPYCGGPIRLLRLMIGQMMEALVGWLVGWLFYTGS